MGDSMGDERTLDAIIARFEDGDYSNIREAIDAITALREHVKQAERERDIMRELYNAKAPLHERRKMPTYAGDEPETPEVLVTLGFWPECRCVECYAIHCLGEARTKIAALKAEIERLKKPQRLPEMVPDKTKPVI